MKIKSMFFLCSFIMFSALYFKFYKEHSTRLYENNQRDNEAAYRKSVGLDAVGNKTKTDCHDAQRNYFKNLPATYDPVLSSKMLNIMWSEINKLPDEKQLNPNSVNSWISIGPNGFSYNDGIGHNTGRILDIKGWGTGSSTTKVAAAGGGLWGMPNGYWAPESDQLTSLIIGSFDTKPGDEDHTWIVGTGEYTRAAGTGLFLTTDAGNSWTSCTMKPITPPSCLKIRYNPNNVNQVFAATESGFFRSDDGGITFNQKLSGSGTGVASDLLIDPNVTGQIWTSIINDGLYKSTDDGNSWAKFVGNGYPSSDIGRTALGTAYNGSTYFIISSVVGYVENTQLGVYRLPFNTTTWQNITPTNSNFDGQGSYNNMVGGAPAGLASSYGVILVGGVGMMRSTDWGTSWTPVTDPYDHADHHAICWNTTGDVWVGDDGGMNFSTDAGVTWDRSANTFPITQYYHVAVGGNTYNQDQGIIAGGCQDNCVTIGRYSLGNINWIGTLCCDGGGVSIDPINQNMVFATGGARSKSTDWGKTWVAIENGIDTNDTFAPIIRNDQSSPLTIYTIGGPYVYFSTDETNWSILNTTAFAADVVCLNVAHGVTRSGACVYASLSQNTGDRLEVYDNNAWYERSAGLPTGVAINDVSVHETNTETAYVLMTYPSPSQKIYRTSNRGVNWTNITGDMPDINLRTLLPHPTNPGILYLGSDMGCFKTTNGGTNWIRWNNGMPQANIVMEFSYIDSTVLNGQFYIVAGTFGRSMWWRNISVDDPVGVKNQPDNLPTTYSY